MPLAVPVLRVLEACLERTTGPLIQRPVSEKPIDRCDAYRMVTRIASPQGYRGTSAPTDYGTNNDERGASAL